MSILRRTALIVLLLLVLIGGACWLYADRILNDLLRPHLEQAAAQALEADVGIEGLRWTAKGLDVIGLSIHRPDDIQLRLAKLETEFTLAALWQRRLDAVHLTAPQIEVTPSPATPATQETPTLFPEQFPLTIGRLTVSKGDLLLETAERRIQLRELAFAGALDREFSFRLSALIGPDEAHPLFLSGHIILSDMATLTLDTLDFQERSLLSRPLSLLLSGSGLEQGGGILHVAQLDHKQLRGILSAFGESYPLPDTIRFALTDAKISLNLEEAALKIGLNVAEGQVFQEDIAIPITMNNIELSGTNGSWLAQGDLAAAGSTISFSARYAHKRLDGRAGILVPHPDNLKTELVGGAPLGLAGKLQFDVEYSYRDGKLHVSGAMRGQAVKLPPNYRINLAQLSGRIDLQHDSGNQLFSIDLRHADRPLLNAAGDPKGFDFTLAPLNLPQLQSLLAPELLPQQLESFNGLMASGRLTSRGGRGWAGKIELASQDAALTGILLEDIGLRGQLQIAAEKLLATDIIFQAGVSKSEELAGQVTGKLSGTFSEKQFSVTLEKLSLVQIGYMSIDGQKGLGNGSVELKGSLQGDFPHGSIALDLSGTAATDEILAGEFYADLSALESRFAFMGEFSPAERTVTLRSLQLTIPELGSANGSGRFSSEDVALRGTVESADLADAYGEHIGPLLSEFRPAAEGLTIEGGLSIDADLRWTPKGWRAFGELRPQGLDAFWEFHEMEVVDGVGRIPFDFSLGQPPQGGKTLGEQLGEISFASLSVGLASLEEGRLQLAAAHNRFDFRSPLLLRLAGGRVAIDALSLGWDQGGPRGSVRVSINDVDLKTLTEELGLPLMKGTFTGDLGLISYADHKLSTAGTVTLEVFGGRFLVRNMRYEAPFSRYPIFHADIDFSGIDLRQATQTFEFGEMNGIVDGHIHGLRLFGATPSAFNARLESRSSGKRNISVKALNNLSIISQGGISAALSRGIYRFIDFYRYAKIGFACALENDTFTLIGTARRDSSNYLVSGSLLPPRIDIITTTPTISFKEMVNRLSRIDRAGN